MDERKSLKPDLERLADRVDTGPGALERLRSRRRRKAIRQRIVAGTMAGVLGVGAAAVVWVAFHGNGETPSVTIYAPPRVPTVWPESGLEGEETPRVVQSRADDHDPEVAWRRSPDKVVHAFVASVLGWSEPDVRSQYPGLETSRRWYSAAEIACPPGTLCNRSGPFLDIEVVQPARQGEGGIWSVATVRSSGLRIVAHESDPPRSGTIRGVVIPAAGLHTVAGVQWFDGCAGANAVLDDIRPGRFVITLPDPVPAAAPGCGSAAAGYVYAYSVPRVTQPVGDPLLESASISDLTIVPIRVQVAGEAPVPSGLAEQVEPVAPKLPPVRWAAYEDPLGWSIAYPPGWGHVRVNDGGMTGFLLTNDPDARVRANGPQHDVFVLRIVHAEDLRPTRYPIDDSTLPLDLNEAFVLHANASGSRSPAYGSAAFRGDGYRLDASVVFGKGMDPRTMRSLDRIVATIRFASLVPGHITGDDELLVLPYAPAPPGRAVIEPLPDGRALLLVRGQGPIPSLYALELDLVSYADVSAWGWDASAREVTYGDYRWTWVGAPLEGDPASQLASYAAAVAWDGHVMVRTKNTALEPVFYWP
ncbi:MAG: hypothetical protein ABI572_12290 [Actinomycetota bacterium]